MKKKNKNIFFRLMIIITIVLTSHAYGRELYYSANKNCGVYPYKIELFLDRHNVDINTRSFRGWMRVLNNEEKRKEYNLVNCSKEEINIIKTYIKERKNMHKGFDRRLR